MRTRRVVRLAPALLLIGYASSVAAQQRSDGIFIVGALHALHGTEPGFDFAALRRVIDAIKPDVMVLEVRPDELQERKDTPGRPEYPQVVWPMLKERSIQAVAMEPGEPLFAELVGAASGASNQFRQRDSSAAAFWSRYQRSLSTALQAHWNSPADAHDGVTADLARSFYITQNALVGEALQRVQDRWDDYMVQRAREVVTAHPRSRVLILASYRNRHRFDNALRAEWPARVVAMDEWLRANVR